MIDKHAFQVITKNFMHQISLSHYLFYIKHTPLLTSLHWSTCLFYLTLSYKKIPPNEE